MLMELSVMEGEWDQLVGLARACHMKEREMTQSVRESTSR